MMMTNKVGVVDDDDDDDDDDDIDKDYKGVENTRFQILPLR